jgi:hypothetical protein
MILGGAVSVASYNLMTINPKASAQTEKRRGSAVGAKYLQPRSREPKMPLLTKLENIILGLRLQIFRP